MTFLLVMAQGHLPAIFALPAGLGDIAAGLAAPFVARRLAQGGGRTRAVWFNLFGILDLVVALSIGFLAGLGPWRPLQVTPSTEPLSLLPLALVPTTAVPLAIALHFVSLARCARPPRPRRTGADKSSPPAAEQTVTAPNPNRSDAQGGSMTVDHTASAQHDQPTTDWRHHGIVRAMQVVLWLLAMAVLAQAVFAGLFLLDDPEVGALPLPDRYGADDIPVILQDKRFTPDGALDFGESPFSPIGRLGDQMLVNGTHDPHLDINHQRVRLRLLNASTARVYNVGFTDDRPFELIGTDGGLLERPHSTTRVPLSPGERAEIVAEFQPSERVVLRSFLPDLGLDGFQGRFAGADDTFDLLQIRAGPRLTPSPPVPDRLARHQYLHQATVVRTRRLELNGSSRINDLRMDLDRIDQTVTVDTTEPWEVTNRSGSPHNFHVHGVQFKVSDQTGAGPPPVLIGWKDTMFLPPASSVRLLVQLPGYSDPTLPYMFHCHLLQHEDNGMMGQFVVVQPGQPPTSPSRQHHHDLRQNAASGSPNQSPTESPDHD